MRPIVPETLDQAAILRRLRSKKKLFAIIFDEMQTLNDPQLKERIRDFVKALSDEKIGVRVFFVGIADSDEELIPPDPSYQEYKMRHFTTARIPPMNEAEILDIINKRQNMFNTQFDDGVKMDLARIASGFPSIAHTLALYSCHAWLAANAGTLIKNWFAQFEFVRKFFPLRVERVNLHIGTAEFKAGLSTYLLEFSRNYEKECKQIVDQLKSSEGENVLRLLSKVTDAGGEGLDVGELGGELSTLARAASIMVAGKLSHIVAHSDGHKLRPKFARLGAVIRGYEYLKVRAPERWELLLKGYGETLPKTEPRGELKSPADIGSTNGTKI